MILEKNECLSVETIIFFMDLKCYLMENFNFRIISNFPRLYPGMYDYLYFLVKHKLH